MSRISVRPARPTEAAVLAEMANDLNQHVGIRTRPFTPERILADALGPDRAVIPLVADIDGVIVGYAFYAIGYNTDVAARSTWLHDLYVAPSARGRGVGRALMAAVAAATLRAGATSLEWGVHAANVAALEFYRRLGAGGGDILLMGLGGERLRALAATSDALAAHTDVPIPPAATSDAPRRAAQPPR
ncbi:MAG TPA: GNAT family N-acetyltransferase [Candidatus Tectomicrobia bacterium]|nr:GNAT family N-acetyltransferase [Candidatus Tectomicrobia bacterium]